MSTRFHATAAAIAVGMLLVACSERSAAPAALLSQPEAPRPEAARTAGAADGLAGALLLAAGPGFLPLLHGDGLLPPAGLVDAALERRLTAIATDHLRSVAVGAGQGVPLLAGQRVRRLAQAVGAPVDRDGDGSNLAESMQAELERIAAFAGVPVFAGDLPVMLPWGEGSPDLAVAAGTGLEGTPARWRTVDAGDRSVRLVDVAGAIRGRVLGAAALLARDRGGLAGGSADDGRLGLLLVEQVLAVEEELATQLSTAGGPLGAFDSVADYDPANGLRWLPAEVEATVAGGAVGYRVVDGASDLASLSRLIEALAELSWFAGAGNPQPAHRAVFDELGPFPPPEPSDPPPTVLSWDGEIRQLISFRCGPCHSGFPTGGFLCDTYAQVQSGGSRTRALSLPMLVPGDHLQSFLFEIVTAPRFPFSRMPPGFQPLPAGERAQIADWIDQGAFEHPPVPPAPPAPGADLAQACFRNLVAMHLDQRSGALDHRHEGDGRSGVATAVATGRALSALARLAVAQPDTEYDGLSIAEVLARCATFAARRLVDVDGRAVDQFDLVDARAQGSADLESQAALTAGLLAAARVVAVPLVQDAAARAAASLRGFRTGSGWFGAAPGRAFARLQPSAIADLLAALELQAAGGDTGAADAHRELLQRLQPALAFAAWSGGGEVADDGIADTDGDGIPEPGLAGGEFGRLPLLTAAILVGPQSDAPPADGAVTWTRHVRPLLWQKCGSCHMGGNFQGGYRCDTVRQIGQAGESGGGVLPLLVPGDPEGSLFFRKLVDRLPPAGQQMPLSGSLLDERALVWIRQWIQDGALAR